MPLSFLIQSTGLQWHTGWPGNGNNLNGPGETTPIQRPDARYVRLQAPSHALLRPDGWRSGTAELQPIQSRGC